MVIKKSVKTFCGYLSRRPVVPAAAVCAVLFYSGVFCAKDRQNFSCLVLSEKIVFVEGTISSSPVKTSSKNFYRADFSAENAYSIENIRSSCTGKITVFIPAEFVERFAPGKLFTKNKSFNVRGENGIFETGARCRFRVSCFQAEKNLFKVERAVFFDDERTLKAKTASFRRLCRLQFKRLMYGWGKAGGLLLALLSGAREYTDGALCIAFKNAGLSHILALSGMHLRLFGGIAFFFGNKITGKKAAHFLHIFAVLFFVWFAGLSPSLLRALITSLILFFAAVFKVNSAGSLEILAATFLIHAALKPEHLYTSAFMLSYGALAGIMTLGRIFKPFLSKFIFPKFSAALADSAGAQLFTFPIAAKMFGAFMPVGIIAAVAVNPIVTFFLYCGLFGIVLCLFLPFLNGPFSVIMNAVYFIIEKTVLFFARVPPIQFG